MKSKLINALKHQAIQDQVGNKFEFLKNIKEEDVLEEYNDFLNGRKLKITDDTQMTLFQLEQLLEDSDIPLEYKLKNTYKKFYYTQIRDFPEQVGLKWGCSELLAFPEMYSRQSPGMTVMNSIQNNFQYKNDSKGCGTVMRGLPYVLFNTHTEYLMDQNLTHHHSDIEIVTKEHHAYLKELLNGNKPNSNLIFDEIYEDGGWTAKPAFNIARYSFENSNSFEELLVKSIQHDGDSDTTAQIQGVMYGLFHNEDIDISNLIEVNAIEYIIELINSSRFPKIVLY